MGGSWTACTATCGNGGKKRRRRYLHLSEGGQARIDNLPDHVKDVMNTYSALQDKVKALRATHLSDVLISFFAGCFTLAAALAVARIFSGSRSRGQRHPALGSYTSVPPSHRPSERDVRGPIPYHHLHEVNGTE